MSESTAAAGLFPQRPHCNAFRLFVEAPGDVVSERVGKVGQPVRSGFCQGALDGSHMLTGCGACVRVLSRAFARLSLAWEAVANWLG
jgi:hypothetical protein